MNVMLLPVIMIVFGWFITKQEVFPPVSLPSIKAVALSFLNHAEFLKQTKTMIERSAHGA